jgi:hypothetical protein
MSFASENVFKAVSDDEAIVRSRTPQCVFATSATRIVTCQCYLTRRASS